MVIPSSVDVSRRPGPYLVVVDPDSVEEIETLPVAGVRVEGEVLGRFARIRLVQLFRNRGRRPIEVKYVFPLPPKGALHGMRMRIGDRVVEARIMERAEARETYEEARQQGRRTALVEEERPNVYVMNVANVAPGEDIEVDVDFSFLVDVVDGRYELRIPLVVGPRFTKTAEGWTEQGYVNTDHSGHPFPVEAHIAVHHPQGVADLESIHHDVSVRDIENGVHVTISEPETAGDRDLVLKWRPEVSDLTPSLMVDRGEDGLIHFLVQVDPPPRPEDVRMKRHYVFVMDTSGSMEGLPRHASRLLLRELLKSLDVTERFQVILFGSDVHAMGRRPLMATPQNVKKALRFYDRNFDGGITDIVPAVEKGLSATVPDGERRTVIIVTDGYITVEKRLFELVRSHRKDTDVFVFLVGDASNSYLGEGIAAVGGGEIFYVSMDHDVEWDGSLNSFTKERIQEEVRRFSQLVGAPLLADMGIQTEGLQDVETYPSTVPSLYGSRPITVAGRGRMAQETFSVTLSGITGDGVWSRTLDSGTDAVDDPTGLVPLVWAREKVRHLVDFHEDDSEHRDEILELGLAHSLVTPYTSLVAVDTEGGEVEGERVQVDQPLPLPHGVFEHAVFEHAIFSLNAGAIARSPFSHELRQVPPIMDLEYTPPRPPWWEDLFEWLRSRLLGSAVGRELFRRMASFLAIEVDEPFLLLSDVRFEVWIDSGTIKPKTWHQVRAFLEENFGVTPGWLGAATSEEVLEKLEERDEESLVDDAFWLLHAREPSDDSLRRIHIAFLQALLKKKLARLYDEIRPLVELLVLDGYSWRMEARVSRGMKLTVDSVRVTSQQGEEDRPSAIRTNGYLKRLKDRLLKLNLASALPGGRYTATLVLKGRKEATDDGRNG